MLDGGSAKVTLPVMQLCGTAIAFVRGKCA
jgi:hypothetical protein